MFVLGRAGVCSRLVGCIGLMLAIVAGTGCGSQNKDPDWLGACQALTPPAPDCGCICRECAQLTAVCFSNADCPPIVACVRQTGCSGNAACLQACGPVIAAHSAGVTNAQAFGTCFTSMCSVACALPDAGPSDGG